MKMRLRVTLHNEDESEVTEATTMEVDVPDFEAFTGPETFGEVFDQYEQTALEARNGAMKAVTEKYLGGMAKKNTVIERGHKEEKVIEKPNDYGIDAEIGRLEVPTFEIKKGSQKVFSTEGESFSRNRFKGALQNGLFSGICCVFSL